MFVLLPVRRLCHRAALFFYLASVLAVDWPPQPPLNKIDTHHHPSPDFWNKIARDLGLINAGLPQPVWSVNTSLELMQRLGVRTAILSSPAPGALLLNGSASHALARQLNNYSASIRDGNPDRFGFFGTLPNLLDTEAALKEIAYALDVLHADGIAIFNRYKHENVSASSQDVYLGHPSLEPIWAELNRRRAAVFLHPIYFSEPWEPFDPWMAEPVLDWPQDTARAVMDMIRAGTRTRYPNCSVILPHAGGTLPYLWQRAIGFLSDLDDEAAKNATGTTYKKAVKDFRSFHYDLANQGSEQMIQFLLDMVPHEHITYGSDYPYAPSTTYPQNLAALESYDMPAELRTKINHKNAEALFPRFSREAVKET